jgi:ATP-dependent protease ClpP protease subunit
VTAPVRMAADVETASTADFDAVQEAWQKALDDLVEQWQEEITPAAREEVLDEIEQLVKDAQTDQLGGVAVTAATVALGAGVVAAAMLALAADATEAMIEEAKRQGVTGITPADVDNDWLDGRANTAATLLTGGYAASAARQAAAVAVPDADPKTVREQVAEHLDTLADRALRDQLGAALSAAQNAGRIAVMEGADEVASYHAVEILDKNTCEPCREIDGEEFDTLADASAAYLTGGYVKCLGRERCRGIVVALWNEKASASAGRTPPEGNRMTHPREKAWLSSPLADQLGALLREGEQTLATRHDPVTSGSLNPPERTDPGFRIESPRAALEEDEEGAPGGEVPSAKEGDRTKLYIYSEIGGWFGVWPEDVIQALAKVKGDIELHLHSPGGDAFDGVAIYNALRSHPGKVFGSIDGLAASAASVIAMACDELEVKLGGQLMIHDAWGYTVGNQADMDKTGEFLGKISDSMAEIYAARAGGSADSWRSAMRAESWYTAREAVEAGLADRLETAKPAAKASWRMGIFAHAGRSDAPEPLFPAGRHELGQWGSVLARSRPEGHASVTPDPQPLVDLDRLREYVEQAQPGETPAQLFSRIHAAAQRAASQTPVASSADGPTHTEGRAAMQPDPIKIREALGLGPEATDEQVSAAWAKAYNPAQAQAPAPAPTAEPVTPGAPVPDLSALAASAKQLGVVMIDPGQLQQMQEMASRGQAAYDKQRRDERDKYIQNALAQGKIALSRKDHWEKAWDADPEGTRDMLDGLAANMVPMEADGYAGAVATSQAEATYFDMYPEDKPGRGGR